MWAPLDPAEAEITDLLATELGRFANERIDPIAIDHAKKIDPRILHDLADMGVFGCSIPEEYGGAGLSLRGICRVVPVLSRRDRAVATTVGLHLGLGTRGLVRFGSEALKERALPELASGEKIAAFAATEPGAGSDLTAISTRGEERDGSLHLRGQKIYVTNGGLAGYFTILASTPGLGGARRGHSLVLLQGDDEGVLIEGEEDKLGLRGSSTTSLHMDDVTVPMDRIIGEPGQGMRHAGHVLAWGRTAMAAGCIGMARGAMDVVLPHLGERRQFGKPLASQPVVRQQVADALARVYAMESIVESTGQADETLLVPRSLAAKVFCSEGAWEIADRSVQLHGGAGFIEETGLPLILRDTRITRIFEGANDVLLVHAGSMEFAAPPARTPLATVCKDPALGAAADAVAAISIERRDALRSELGLRLARRPRLLRQLGRLFTLREVTDAAVMRADFEGTPMARARALHWAELARRAAPRWQDDPMDLDAVDAIAGPFLSGEAPLA